MAMRRLPIAAALGLVVGVAACGGPLPGELEPGIGVARAGLTQSITYVGKQSTTDFTGLGQHLQYFPYFGQPSGQTARRTDDSCIELTPDFADFKHHYLPVGRTFSNDALGSPIGTKTRGGYPTWPMFKLPDGTLGRAGTFYDESNVDNSNNTVNEMRINVSTLSEFCLNLITDNTNGENDPDVQLEARSDTVDVGLAGHPDLTFDGQTDMYTFRYQGMKENDIIKVRMQCSSASGCKGAGLGGMMVSHISTCTPGPGGPDGGPAAADGGAADLAGPSVVGLDAGAADGGGLDPGGAGGCGCRVAVAPGGGSQLALLLLLASLTLRRRLRGSAAAPARPTAR